MNGTNYTCLGISVDNIYFAKQSVEGSQFNLKPEITKKTEKISDNEYAYYLKCEIKNKEECPFPVDITIIIHGLFAFKNPMTNDEINAFMESTGIRTVFPYLRSTLTSLTTTAMINPIVLPILPPEETKI